ncbi:MAG: hypothetical protein ACOX64_00580 [Candidatus Merdivicinus sp.]
MAKKKHILPQVDSSKIEELLTVQKKLEELPRDKLMYIAGAVAAMSADVPTTTSKTWRIREILIEHADGTRTNINDMTPEERRAAARRINDAAMDAIGYYRIGSENDPNVQNRE